MRLIVTSASGTNGDGYGTVLAFTPEGELMGRFSNDAVRELATTSLRVSPTRRSGAVPALVKRITSLGRDRPADQFETVILTWVLKALPPGPKASDNSA